MGSGIRRALGLAWAGLVLGGLATTARADEFLVLPLAGITRESAPPTELDRATGLVDSLLARLETAGHTIRAIEEADLELATSVLACDTSACASAGLQALRTDAIVAPAYWRARDTSGEFSVSVLGRSGNVLELTTPIVGDALAPAIDSLVARLLDAWPEHRGEPRPSVGPRTTTPRQPWRDRRPSAWNMVAGVSALAGAVAPLAIGLRTLAHDGECVEPRPDGGCEAPQGRVDVVSFGPRSAALVGVGAALASVGVVFLAARPIRVSARASRDSVAVEGRLRF